LKILKVSIVVLLEHYCFLPQILGDQSEFILQKM